MSHHVVFAVAAEAQLVTLYRYIAQEAGPDIAERFTGAIVQHCERLEVFPHRGTPRDDIRPGLRTIPFRRRVTIAYHYFGRFPDIGSAMNLSQCGHRLGGGRAKMSRMACLIAGMVGCGGGPATLFFPSRCFEAARLEEGEGDHCHQAMSVQSFP